MTAIALTSFARARLFPKDRRLNAIQDISAEEFERYLNQHAPEQVLDGYAPFCKLHVHRNWTSTRCYTMPITDDNRHLLRSAYEARTKADVVAEIEQALKKPGHSVAVVWLPPLLAQGGVLDQLRAKGYQVKAPGAA